MVEGIVIGILFIGAVVYLLNLLKHNFKAKEDGCAKGCGTCSTSQLKNTNKASATPPFRVHLWQTAHPMNTGSSMTLGFSHLFVAVFRVDLSINFYQSVSM